MRAKIRMPFAILTERPVPRTVGESGFQSIEIDAPNIQPPIRHHTREMLPHALPHDARLAMMDREAFLMQNRGYVGGKPFHTMVEILSARKRQIVGVPRVVRSGTFGETEQPAIGAIETHVGQRGGCRRALWKMGASVHRIFQDIARDGVGGDTAEQIGHRFRVAQGAKYRLNPRTADGRKEVLEVHSQHHALPHVGSGERLHGAPLDESMGRGMWRNLVQNARQNVLLDPFQTRFWRFDQSNGAAAFVERAIVVVSQFRLRPLIPECFQIGEPVQFARSQRQPIGQVSRCFDGWDVPPSRAHSRRRYESPHDD